MTYFMTSSFAKIMFSLIRNVLLCFLSGSQKCAYSTAHQLAARREFLIQTLECIVTDTKYFTG